MVEAEVGAIEPFESLLAPLLPIRGNRLQLRGWRLGDVAEYQRWMQPGHAWQRTDGPYFAFPDVRATEGVASRLRERIPLGNVTMGDPRVLIADLDGTMLGTVNRYRIDDTGWTAIGIALFDEATWGRGYGREALALWLDLLFRAHPELHRLDLRTWSGNVGMMRVAEALGFTLEARFREARVVDGVRYDGLGYGVLRTEWQAMSH